MSKSMEKMVEYINENGGYCHDTTWHEMVLAEARRLLSEEQEQKPPTDMAGLVEEVEGWVKRFSSNYPALSELREILSRYARPTSGQEGKVAESEEPCKGYVCYLANVKDWAERSKEAGLAISPDDVIGLADELIDCKQRRHPSTDKCGEVILWEGLVKSTEPEFMLAKREGGKSVALFPVKYETLKGKRGQIIFRESPKEPRHE